MNAGERELYDALSAHYAGTAYAVIPQVPRETGGNARTADALVMSLWPSRGLDLMGFEFKRTRADWMAELRDPSKAEAICQFCDRWWILVLDKDIVKEGELPPTWGLMRKYRNGTKVVTKAPKLEPAPIDRSFLAALLRKVAEGDADERELQERYSAGYKAGRKVEADRVSKAVERKEERWADLQENVKEFEAASGLSLHSGWELEEIGEAVRAIVRGDRIVEQTIKRIFHQASALRATAANMDLILKQLNTAQDKEQSNGEETDQ